MTTETLPSKEERRALLERTKRDPVWFARNVLGIEPYDKQIELVESVRDNQQTTVNGANGVGKDWTIGQIIIPWWMAAHADSGQAKVVVTAPTARQINEIVWRETRFAYNNSKIPLGGRMLPVDPKWDISDQYFAFGFSTDKAFNITGFHSPHLLVIVSEAHNFPDDAMVMIKRLLPERLLLSGNPFSQSGEFFASHHEKRHLYNAITITAYDSPNVKAGVDGLVPGVVGPRDIELMLGDWGEDSPFFKATVGAEFTETEDGLIPLHLLLAAGAREAVDDGGDCHAGVDVAGPGEDETVVTVRRGSNIIAQKGWRIPDPRGEVVVFLDPFKPRLKSVNVDSIGIGYNFGLHIRDMGYQVRLVNVSEAADDSEHFNSLKAELYWGLRQRFKDGDVNGLTSEQARGQLASIRYGHNARGQVQIESKEQARKRGVKSPDYAESVMLAFAFGDWQGSTAGLIEKFSGRTQEGLLTVAERDRRDDARSSGNIASKEF